MMKTMLTKTTLAGSGLVLALSGAAVRAADTAADAAKNQQLQRMYTSYLTDEGYKPTVDDKGNVVFKRDGHTYVIPL